MDVNLPNDLEIAARILLAAGLGGLVGLEREIADQSAGLRTHITVALGACLFGIISAYGFQEFVDERARTNYQIDVTRVASQIVVGVGFLGGGAILKEGATVRGLTTAASLWVTAAIGLGAALGSYLATAVTTAALLLSLAALRRPRRWIKTRLAKSVETVVFHLESDANPTPVMTALTQMSGITVRSIEVQEHEDEILVHAEIKGHFGRRRQDIEALGKQSGITDIDIL